MPDLRQPVRRLIDSRFVSRTAAHLSVIALLALSSAFGFATTQSPRDGSAADTAGNSLAFVSAARGAAKDAHPGQSAHFEIQADPLRADPMLSRKAVPTQPPTPVATPVAPPAATPEQAPAVAAQPQTGAATASRGGSLLWPVPGGVISQYYHAGHLALDIAARVGRRVNAAEGGVVVWAGWRNNGGGYVVQIDHGNGIQTAYNHLGAMWVYVGQRVAAGQGIAAVGCSGSCTGPHVHFEVIVGGVYVNPLRYL